jgi:hypothetical protein
MPLSSTVSCQVSCAAVKDTRPPRPGGNACTNASVTSRSAMSANRVTAPIGRASSAATQASRGPPDLPNLAARIITKAPQKAVERHLCRGRDTAEERADRRHAHHTAGSSSRRAQTCRLRKESDRRHAEEGWTRPQPGAERWLLPDRSTSSVRSWTRAPCLRSQLRCSLSRPPQASDPRVLAPRRPGATGRRRRGHERRRGGDAQACSRCHPHPRSARPTPSRWPSESTVPAGRSSECSSVRRPRCGPPISRSNSCKRGRRARPRMLRRTAQVLNRKDMRR